MAAIYRTTQSSLTTGVMNNLQKSLDRLGTTQAKMSSGKEVAKPSDSPVATASAMRYRSDMKATEQHLRNAEDRKSTRLNSSHVKRSRMPSSA